MSNAESKGIDFGSNYTVLEKIGSGASGIVYKGVQKDTSEDVAIKFLREEYREDEDIVRRFITERTSLIGLSHKRIIRTKDLIADGGKLGIVMDYASGPTLKQYLDARGTLPPKLALTITEQLLEGIQYAHENGIVHRDLKPENVILTNHRDQNDLGVVITDFGIASILGRSVRSTTRMVGTPSYMAPELIRDGTIAPSVDIYAAGIICYQLIAGYSPFDDGQEDNPFLIANRHLTMAPPGIPGLDEKTWILLATLLSKDPSKRNDSAQSIALLKDAIPNVSGLPALQTASPTSAFHAATVLKPEKLSAEKEAASAALSDQKLKISRPVLAPIEPSTTATVLKPQLQNSDTHTFLAEPERHEESTAWWKHPRHRIALIVCTIAVLLVVAGLSVFLFNRGVSSGSHEEIDASLEDKTLPSGLVVNRTATWNPKESIIDYTVSYSTNQKPISGQVLEVISDQENACLEPAWVVDNESVSVKPHSQAVTSLNASCAWTISMQEITTDPTQIHARITPPHPIENREELDAWLTKISEDTHQALSSTKSVSTAYPLQRLQSMRIDIPSRVEQGDPVPLTIFGVWPGGENKLTPIYTSPKNGEPTSILDDITGKDASRLRLIDRCSGAVAISSDGHDAAALFPANCSIGATAGNYEIDEASLTIAQKGS